MKSTERNDASNQEMVTISRAEYEAMQAKLTTQNKQLEAKSAELAQALLQNQWLTEQLLVKKRKLFGSSSEVLDQMVMEQFAHLFNEAECWDAAGRKPAVKTEKKPRKRRNSGSVQDIIPEGTPVEVVEHRLPEEERICGVCGKEMVEFALHSRWSLPVSGFVRIGITHMPVSTASRKPGKRSLRLHPWNLQCFPVALHLLLPLLILPCRNL